VTRWQHRDQGISLTAEGVTCLARGHQLATAEQAAAMSQADLEALDERHRADCGSGVPRCECPGHVAIFGTHCTRPAADHGPVATSPAYCMSCLFGCAP
jgi:hypothetical protein